jgi:hypothetical protein
MLASPQFIEPEYWRRQAEKTRAMAKQLSSEESKKMMFKLADAYDFLAVRAAILSQTEGS